MLSDNDKNIVALRPLLGKKITATITGTIIMVDYDQPGMVLVEVDGWDPNYPVSMEPESFTVTD